MGGSIIGIASMLHLKHLFVRVEPCFHSGGVVAAKYGFAAATPEVTQLEIAFIAHKVPGECACVN